LSIYGLGCRNMHTRYAGVCSIKRYIACLVIAQSVCGPFWTMLIRCPFWTACCASVLGVAAPYVAGKALLAGPIQRAGWAGIRAIAGGCWHWHGGRQQARSPLEGAWVTQRGA